MKSINEAMKEFEVNESKNPLVNPDRKDKKIEEASSFFATDSLEMKRLGIKSTINWTVSAITGKSKYGEYTGLIEVDDHGAFNYELFIGKKHYDDGSFKTKPIAEIRLLDFISDLEATGLI